MRIASIILRDFKPFKDSGISEINVTFTDKVQVIIGTNGSGKTQFMKQLTSYPPVRTIYGKQGFKSQVMEKDGVYYRLESEFEKPSSPHLFFEGESEENLNQGRTTETQRELIAEHLGITPVVNDLIMNAYTFPAWGAAKRKEFLMSINPDQIAFIDKARKDISTKIKGCRSNLARLAERKIILEQQLVDDDTMELLNIEKQKIGDDLGHFQEILTNIEVGIRTIGHVQPVSLNDIPTIRNLIKRYRYQLVHLSHIERHDQARQREREQTLSAIAVCSQQLQEKDEDLTRQADELVELETRYRELDLDGDIQAVDLTIERLETEQERLQIQRPAFELSKEDLNLRYQELDELRDRLLLFSDLSITLLPNKRRQRREQVLQTSQYRQGTWGMRLNDLEAQYADLTRRHSLKPSDIPDSPCAKNACPLYTHFMGEYENAEERRLKLKRAIEKGQRKIARLNALVAGLITYQETARPYLEQINWLVNYAQSNPVLHQLLRQMDTLSVLATNPNQISRKLQDAYDRIEQWLKLRAVTADLETARALKSRQLSLENSDTVKLVANMERLKVSLYTLRDDIERISEKRQALTAYLADIDRFNLIKTELFTLRDQHRAMTESLANAHEKENLTILRRGIEELRSRHFMRMGTIETTLRTQAGIRERYEEEIVSQILIIDKELADQQQIETALIAIPKGNMVDFINDIFDQANVLINMIWMVPLQIERVDIEAPLTYEFQVIGDNQSSRELSECSEGQTEILTLAINLAIRMVLEHFNYPLMLDETGRTFDEKHRHNLIMLLKRLIDDKVISQLFLISHHAAIHEAFSESETLVIREDNIILPESYNKHATIK